MYRPETATPEVISYGRNLAACAAALLALTGTAPAYAKNPNHAHRYNLDSIYPNMSAVRQGLHLEGANVDPSQNGQRAVLWFEGDGPGFIQHSYDPNGPNGNCQSDRLAWQPGSNGSLVYSETDDDCGPVKKTFLYDKGIVFAPRSWQDGQTWSRSGTSNTTYLENDAAVCSGANRWRSYVAGEITLPNGETALHTHTTEYQDWQAVPGAPESDLCPPGQNGEYKWNENFYFSQSVPVVDKNGNSIGTLPGLAGSFGGNAERPGGTHWKVMLTSWQN